MDEYKFNNGCYALDLIELNIQDRIPICDKNPFLERLVTERNVEHFTEDWEPNNTRPVIIV